MSFGVFYGMLATRRAFTTWPTTTMQYRQRLFALVQSWLPFLGESMRAGLVPQVSLAAQRVAPKEGSSCAPSSTLASLVRASWSRGVGA